MLVSNHIKIDELVTWFRNLLCAKGVRVFSGSQLDRDLAAVSALGPVFRGERDVPPDVLDLIRDGHAVLPLIAALRATIEKTESAFDRFWPIFKGTDVGLTRGRRVGKHKRHLAWEMFVAAIAAQIGDEVTMDEPDVTLMWRGERWGIPCKVLNSMSVNQQVKTIVKAAKQLEDSPAKYGVIAANVTNLLDHHRYWDRAAPTIEEVMERFGNDMVAVAHRLHRIDLFHRLRRDGSGAPRDKTRSLMIYGQAMVASRDEVTQMFCPIWPDGWRTDSAGERDLLLAWNEAVQRLFPMPSAPAAASANG